MQAKNVCFILIARKCTIPSLNFQKSLRRDSQDPLPRLLWLWLHPSNSEASWCKLQLCPQYSGALHEHSISGSFLNNRVLCTNTRSLAPPSILGCFARTLGLWLLPRYSGTSHPWLWYHSLNRFMHRLSHARLWLNIALDTRALSTIFSCFLHESRYAQIITPSILPSAPGHQ